MRTGAAITLPALIGESSVFYAEVLAWIGADVVLISSYFYVIGKLKKIFEG